MTSKLLQTIRGWASTQLVRLTLSELNDRQARFDQAVIDALDRQWVEERKADDQPLITAVLSSPLSGYLLCWRLPAGWRSGAASSCRWPA